MVSSAWVSRGLALLVLVGCADTNDGSTVVPSPSIETFTATPQTVLRGASSTLSWEVTGASGLVVEDGEGGGQVVAVGADAQSGSASVTPGATTTYTLRAVAERDGQVSAEVTAEVTVTVVEPPQPTLALTVSPEAIAQGATAVLSWTTTDADTLALDAGGEAVSLGDADIAAGSVEVTPEATTTYAMTATGPGGSVQAEVTVTVLALPTIDVFEVAPTQIPFGASAELAWETTDADSVAVFTGETLVADGLTADGTLEVNPEQTTVYTLVVEGDGGQARSDATLTVDDELRVTLDGPESIDAGQSAQLTWTTNGATRIELVAEPGGIVDTTGKAVAGDSVSVTPEQTAVYTLTASRDGATEMASVTVTVAPRVVITALTATPDMVFTGEATTVAWATENATQVQLRDGDDSVIVEAAGQRTIEDLSGPRTFTLVAEGVGGPVEQSVSVDVTDRPIPVIRSFTVNPDAIGLDETATLAWEVGRAQVLRLRGDQDEGPGVDVPVGDDQLETGSVEVSPFLSTRYTLTAMNEDGEVTAQATLEVPAAILEFRADPLAIQPDDAVEVAWRVQGVFGLELNVNGEPVPDVAFGADGRGGVTLRGLSPPLLIELHVRNNEDDLRQTIEVDGLPPDVREFASSVNEVGIDGLATLNWLTTRGLTDFQLVAQPAVGDGFDIDVPPALWEDGVTDVTPVFDTTYVLNISNGFGFQFAVVQVAVPLRILAFEAVPNPAVYGEDVELRWTVQGAQGVEYRLGGAEPTVGFVGENGFGTGELVAVTQAGTVELTAFVGENGRVTDGLELTIAAPVIEAFEATPDVGQRGEVFMLSWRNRGAATIAVEATDARGTYTVDVGLLDPKEDFIELPLVFATTFELTATNPTGTAVSQETVTISNEVPEILAFGADPQTVDVGGSTLLSWTTVGAVEGKIVTWDAEYGEVLGMVDLALGQLDSGSLTLDDIGDFTYLELRVRGVNDDVDSARLTVGVHGESGTLRVSELFYDAGNLEPRLQWIELYNEAPFDVNLVDTAIGYGLGDWTVTTLQGPTLRVPAFGCVVVAGPDSEPANHLPVFDAAFLLPAVIPRAGARAAGLALFWDPADEVQRGDNAFDGVVYGDALQEGDVFDIHGADAFAPFVEDAPPGSSLHRLFFDLLQVNGVGDDKDPVEELGIEAFPEFYVLDAPTPGRCYGLWPASPGEDEDAQVFQGRRRGPEAGGNSVGIVGYHISSFDTEVLFGGQLAQCQDEFPGGLLCVVPPGTGRVDLTLRNRGQGEIVYRDWYEYEPIDFCILQFPPEIVMDVGETEQIFGRVYEAGVTDAPGDSGAFVVQWGYGPAFGDAAFAPETFAWFDARYNVQVGNDDEYMVDFLGEREGRHRHAFRVRPDASDIWTYCDADGTVNNAPDDENFFEAQASGTLEVLLPQ